MAETVKYTEYEEKGVRYRSGSDGSLWVRDPGGETNFGISKRSYPSLDIANLTRQQAEEIYRRDYWMPSGANNQSWPMCLAVLDTAVLHGAGQAAEWMNKSNGSVWQLIALRLVRYPQLQSWHYHGAGWCNRVARLIKVCAA